MDTKPNHLSLHIGPDNHVPKKAKEKRNIKSIFLDAGKQILVSLLILVIAFLAMNWEAYYTIAKNKIEKFMGVEQGTELSKIIEQEEVQRQPKIVATDQSTLNQIKTIPSLPLEIMPPDTRLIIPRINQNIPVVRVSSEYLIEKDWNALEGEMQEALKGGVVHYPGTSLPDQTGNTVITGHSSYFPWDPGRFKDVFALLHDVVIGDKIALYYNQHKYIYEISDIQIVLPSNIDILKQTPDKRLTLITCHPIGTNLKRLIVTATLVEEQI